MRRWIYHTEGDPTVAEINALGQQEWELVAVFASGATIPVHYYVFKKQDKDWTD